ncbi:SMP-30/gluconolactonase/LRE family protein [Rhodohalobacter sulfatireducens]|uniref:SMP-30/gluconolactonase/LRE family protein n=1 Tax=Rhodohalobacter sulfatireducens TaxID=2911366 RepID=A0ABS9KEZ3_9BACT|nr:SMP-30/gluconolactonase/LRE family protein [Rhodohalobacter sulfatireducens]MCG2589403.1 SMP-30/gluconolactonase/LRE family protein [Rhodohalobacter sulfatireducens]
MFRLALTILALFLISNYTLQAQSPVIADGTELNLVSDQFSFTEGPAADSEGNVYFTDQPNNDIWIYTIDGELNKFMDESGRSNGLYFAENGDLLACADAKNELWSISPHMVVEVLVDGYEGKRLNGPNDLWPDPSGGIYFTDPYYQREYWDHTEKEIEEERVYYLSPDREDLIIVDDDLVQPNGIIGSPDGNTLYVADIGDGKTYSYTIHEDGTLSNKTLFTEMGSDGVTLDEQGNLYLTGDGVTVFNQEGEQIEHISVPQNWTANVTFGGTNNQTLFITASTAVYTLEMKVKGAS